MLARLQRGMMLALALAALVWLTICWRLGWPLVGVLGAALMGLGYTIVLAAEFALMSAVHGADPAPRAAPSELLRAWFNECVVAAQVFGWRQPFRSRRFADVPGRPGVRGIVFVHGYVCNRGLWSPWLERCAAARRPCIAIDLEPVFSGIDAYVPQLEAAVARLEQQTGMAPVLVCHSMGGLAVRAWLAETPGADARVHRVVTIGSPHHGTWLARLSRTANALHMRHLGEWVRALGGREPPARAARFTCFYGHCDNIVFPPSAATLTGADNRHLRATAHVAMAFHPDVIDEVERWVAGAAAAEGAAAP